VTAQGQKAISYGLEIKTQPASAYLTALPWTPSDYDSLEVLDSGL